MESTLWLLPKDPRLRTLLVNVFADAPKDRTGVLVNSETTALRIAVSDNDPSSKACTLWAVDGDPPPTGTSGA
jgi:hypothetical protein